MSDNKISGAAIVQMVADATKKEGVNLKAAESTFPEHSPESRLYMIQGIATTALKKTHDLFTLRFEGDDLVADLKHALARDIYSADITEDIVDSISYIDLILSPSTEDSMQWAGNRAGRFGMVPYHQNNSDDQLDLLCHIMYGYFMSRYRDVLDTSNIDRPIPLQLFLELLKKGKAMKVMHTDHEGHVFGGTLNNISLQYSFFGPYIWCVIDIISKGKDGYVKSQYGFELPYIRMVSSIEDFGLKEVNDESMKVLMERGRKYIECTKNPHYCSYNGFAFRRGGWFGDIRLTVSGRVMIDAAAMRTLNSELSDSWYIGNPFNSKACELSSLKEEDYWMCSPVVYGFSFGTKDWCRMDIDNISEIKFSETAFDELIIPEEYKEIFIACMVNDMPSLDSIDGKGKGKIFLLSGPPGCGKTLSAESVAEHLKMPLYYVSVGELGTSPEEMEENLSQVMNVALSWDAIVLLDEVDVFAVKRNGSDIQRNAMTAILLRLLERYSGIIFMTTNLLENLDEAFVSRATATIEYNGLTEIERAIIWKSLLAKAEKGGITVSNEVKSSIDTLSAQSLNGREIKNRVRLAYSVALSKGDKTITMDILNKVIRLRTCAAH